MATRAGEEVEQLQRELEKLKLQQQIDNLRASQASQPKTIFYKDSSEKVKAFHFPDAPTLERFLGRHKADCLIDQHGVQCTSFLSLQDRATYVLSKETVAEPLAKNFMHAFDFGSLCKPHDVILPKRRDTPKFTCQTGWMDAALATIETHLNQADADDSDERVSPMALVRCSRGGKTRTINEIAHHLRERNAQLTSAEQVAIIAITFNEHSPLDNAEQSNPLQALCRRIVFEASRERTEGEDKFEAYDNFRARNYYVDPNSVATWLKDSNAVLLVDELNNLQALNDVGSAMARNLGNFIRMHFLKSKGRYFIFSSHVVTTAENFTEFVDSSNSSSRKVMLRSLPRIQDLPLAITNLNSDLGARLAVYFGLIPALIYESSRLKGRVTNEADFNADYDPEFFWLSPKQVIAVRKYSALPLADKDSNFIGILRSLVDGNVDSVPPELHNLLDAGAESGEKRIRWIPCMLEYLLRKQRLSAQSGLADLSLTMADLLRALREAKHESGEGWESLFVFQILVRCICGLYDDFFLPATWSVAKSVLYNPYKNPGRTFEMCRTLKQVKQGFDVRNEPTVGVFFPSHDKFEEYDAFVVLFDEGEWVDCRAFQLKEGKGKPDWHRMFMNAADISKRFVINGDASNKASTRKGWTFPTRKQIAGFCGESGRTWTPHNWKLLSNTLAPVPQVGS